MASAAWVRIPPLAIFFTSLPRLSGSLRRVVGAGGGGARRRKEAGPAGGRRRPGRRRKEARPRHALRPTESESLHIKHI